MIKKIFRKFRRVRKRKAVGKPLIKAPKTKEIATKRKGLLILNQVCKGTNSRVLPSKTYYDPKKFSLSDFGKIENSRLIVRTDPFQVNSRLEGHKWASLPRNIFTISSEKNSNTEIIIREWMKRQQAIYENKIAFVVHKVPLLKEYRKNIRIHVNLRRGQGKITITTGNIRNERTFRGIKERKIEIDLTESKIKLNLKTRRKLHKILDPQIFRSKKLMKNVLGSLQKIIDYAIKTNEPHFELSAVTYKKNPSTPEFYDLILGKFIRD